MEASLIAARCRYVAAAMRLAHPNEMPNREPATAAIFRSRNDTADQNEMMRG
jgi:hypothetical protein